MSSLTISDRRSLANIEREIGPALAGVRRLEVRPEAGPPGRAEVTAVDEPGARRATEPTEHFVETADRPPEARTATKARLD